jgi:purine-binding chemotaxis protein CheW
MRPTRQYLTFALDREEYGLDILRVQEIKGYPAVTPIPNAPRHVRGVMNLRGTVIPVVDLRARFGMPVVVSTQLTVIIIVVVADKIIGLVVDAVSDVVDIASDDIEPPPDMGSSVDTTFVAGLAKTGDRLTLLLDLDRLIGGRDLLAA